MTTPNEVSHGPLEGTRVLDASTFIAGPLATTGLADLGASVIKVEPSNGDPGRRAGWRVNGEGVLFANTNRGKRSVVLDLKDPADSRLMTELIGQADVFVQNWRPGVAERLGLSDGELSTQNRRLVYVAITAFGTTGPRSQAPGFDGNLQALSALAWHNSHEGRPERIRAYLVDKVTAGLVAQAILAGLLHRERTGAGMRIDINMLDSAAYFNFPDVFEHRTAVVDPASRDLSAARSAHDVVKTVDGFLIVAPGTAAHLQRACAAVGHPEWYADFQKLKSFASIGPMLNARLEDEFSDVSTADALRLLEEHDVPACEVLDLDGHLADPQIVHNDTYGFLDHDVLGRHRYPRFPAHFTPFGGEGELEHEVSRFPDVGEHGAAIRAARAPNGTLDDKEVWSWS